MELREILRHRSGFALRKIQSEGRTVAADFVGVICDNCRRFVGAASIEQLVPKLADWYIDPEIGSECDLCPDCVRRQ